MNAASVIVTTQSARWDNLCQTIRLLERGEPSADMELVVVSQDTLPDAPPTSLPCKVVELGLTEFRKGLLVNSGVRASSRDVLWLLDGDRVNRTHYLRDVLDFVMGEGEVIAPHAIRNLERSLTDDEIHKEREDPWYLPGSTEGRHQPNVMFCKTHFSGNAVLRRSDFELAGWMDESWSGYGFSDNDFGMACLRAGLVLEYSASHDTHLWHRRECGSEAYWRQNAMNAIRFTARWGLAMPNNVPEQLRHFLDGGDGRGPVPFG